MADYATLAEVKARVQKTNTDWDTYGQTVIEGVSRAIDNYTNRPDGFVALTSATARVYAGNGLPIIRIDESVEITLVEVKDAVTSSTYTAWAATDWIAFSGDKTFPNFNDLPYDQLMVDINGDYSVFTNGNLSQPSRDDIIFNDIIRSTEKYFYNPRSARAYPTVRVTAKWGYAVTVPPQIKEVCCMQSARVIKRYEAAQSNQLSSTEFGILSFELDPDIQTMLTRMVKPGSIGRR